MHGWKEVELAVEMVYESSLASRSDDPFRGAIIDIMSSDVAAHAPPMPSEAVAQIGRHFVSGEATRAGLVRSDRAGV